MDQILTLTKFSGLNTREQPNAIAEHELSSVVNFNLGLSGQLEKRTGVNQVNTSVLSGASASIQMLGFFITDTYQQFIARDGTNLYYSTDAKVWTVMPGGPWNAVECGVQYTDKFYMVRKIGTVIEWNGVTAAGITNSPAGTFCKIFKDRLFVIHTEGAGAISSRLYFSNALNLSSTGWPATNYVGINEGDGDRLVALAIVSDYLLVFKAKAIWNLFVQGSDTLSWILRPFRSDTGCVSRHSIVSREGVIFFAGVDGVYTTDGAQVRLISSPVGNYFELVTADITTLNQISAFFWKDKYVVTLPAYATQPLWNTWAANSWAQLSDTLWDTSSSNNVYLVYHVKVKGWTRWDFPYSSISPHRFVVVTGIPNLIGVYAGDRSATGRVMKYGDTGYTDAGNNIPVSFETKAFDLDKPTQKKRGKWVGIELAGAGAVTAKSTVDGNSLVSVTTTVTTELELRVKGPGYFRTWRFGLTSTTNTPLSIYKVNMYVDAKEYRPLKKSSI